MGRCIQFRDNSNSSCHGIVDNTFDIIHGVYARQCTRLCDFRVRGDEHREVLGVNDVPMENIEFVVEHAINGLQNVLDWDEVS